MIRWPKQRGHTKFQTLNSEALLLASRLCELNRFGETQQNEAITQSQHSIFPGMILSTVLKFSSADSPYSWHLQHLRFILQLRLYLHSFLYHSVFRSSLQRIKPHYTFPGLLEVPWKYWWTSSQSCSSCILSAFKTRTIIITQSFDTSLVHKGTSSNHRYSSFMELFP